MINKDTKIFGSFSANPGNNGCKFFNKKFKSDGINAIYKSFYSDDIESSIQSAITLGFTGFAVSMPFKTEIIQYLDKLDNSVKEIGACNTVIISSRKLYGYNTDWKGVYNYLFNKKITSLSIYGNGGFSKAVQYACTRLKINFEIITRSNWEQIPKYEYSFNATPVNIEHKNLIDGRPHTVTGMIIAGLQANEQYKIYTNELS
jgi:shikimate 5-dehydrogenase